MIEKSRAYGPDGSSKMPSFNDSMTVQEGEEFMKRRDFILSMLSTGLAGPLRSTKDSRADTTADGKGVLIPANEMVSNQPSAVSLMPEGLENALTVQDFRDLLAFLLLRN